MKSDVLRIGSHELTSRFFIGTGLFPNPLCADGSD